MNLKSYKYINFNSNSKQHHLVKLFRNTFNFYVVANKIIENADNREVMTFMICTMSLPVIISYCAKFEIHK